MEGGELNLELFKESQIDGFRDVRLASGESWDTAFKDGEFVGHLEFQEIKRAPHDISINNASLRAQTTRLQYMDILAGQLDRSQANYFFDVKGDADGGKTVALTAIDNDLAWGTRLTEETFNREIDTALGESRSPIKLRKLPPFADQQIIDAFNDLSKDDLHEMFADLLSPAEIDAACSRLEMIKDHLNSLPADQIIKDWGKPADEVFQKHATEENCYLMRDAAYFKPE